MPNSHVLKSPLSFLFLNDYPPEALTSAVTKCFVKLVRGFITSSLPDILDPLQTANCPNCSIVATSNSTIVKFTDDTVVVGLISDKDQKAYLEEIKSMEDWCH